MEQLTQIKGKEIVVPRLVKRYLILAYYNYGGWSANYMLYTTPESAVQSFVSCQEELSEESRPLYYKVLEVEVEIPFVPKNK